MPDLTIEVCRNRKAAEARKEQLRQNNPGVTYKTRIVDGMDSSAMFLADGDNRTLRGEAFGSDLDVSEISVLFFWT